MSTLNMDMNVHVVSRTQSSIALSQIVKRALDFGLVVAASFVAVPLMLMIGATIKLTSPGPIFYSQRRVGRNGNHFFAWKLRTMVVNADETLEQYLQTHPELRKEWERDHKLKNDPRVTSIGHLLRKTSLDELPQLWNVFCGEMSLVGPRPIVDAEIKKYGEAYRCYSKVLPGITGLWQVSGRNNTTYEERVAFDDYYVRHWSLWMDTYILLKTVRVVLLREGAY